MYFKQFPKILYDFPFKAGEDTGLQVLTDITTNVRVRKEILENITLYDEYDIKEGETPEIIAEKVYGNPELHWVIMLVNQRYDYLKDYPMASDELYNFCIDTYGADGLDRVHHYEKDGIVSPAQGIIEVPFSIYREMMPYDVLDNPLVNALVTAKSTDGSKYYASIVVNRGQFVAGQTLNLYGVRLNTATRQSEYMIVADYLIINNGFTLATGYEIVTNFAHEDKVNEGKRRIKLISKNLINQIVNEFKNIVTP